MNIRSGIFAGCIAVILLTGIGCSDKNSVPSGILSREKMENVLWDMIQADQYSALYLAKDSAHINTKMENLRLYEQVFRLHQVSREEFRKSYQYYLDHPSLNQILFDSLISRGNRLRTESYSRPVPTHPFPVTPAPGANPPFPVAKPQALPVGSHLDPVKLFPNFRSRDSIARHRDSVSRGLIHPAKNSAKKDTAGKRS